MKLTPEHIKKLIVEELEQLLEQGKQYYITIPDNGWAILSDENGKEISNLWTAIDHVRDPVGIHGSDKEKYIHHLLLNRYWESKDQPKQKSKEWWENIYGFLRQDARNLTEDEKQRFSNHPTISPSRIKSLAGIFSLFKRIPLENISFAAAALPADGGESSASSFKPVDHSKFGMKKQLSNLFGRRKNPPTSSQAPTTPTTPAKSNDDMAAIFAGGNKAF